MSTLVQKLNPRLLRIYARFILRLDDYQTQTAQRRSWFHAKNARCQLLANGTTMTRAELMRHAHLHRQQTKTPGRHCPGAKSAPSKNNYAFKGAALLLPAPAEQT